MHGSARRARTTLPRARGRFRGPVAAARAQSTPISSNSSAAACPRRLKRRRPAQARALFRRVRGAARRAGGRAEPIGGLVSVNRSPGVGLGRSRRDAVSSELGKPYFAFDERWLKRSPRPRRRGCRSSASQGDSMAPTLNAGRRHTGRPGRLRRPPARRDLCASGRRCAGGQAARAQSRGAAGDGPVGQSGLSRLARLQPRRNPLHRPGDLVGAARWPSGAASGRRATPAVRPATPGRGPDHDARHRVADGDARRRARRGCRMARKQPPARGSGLVIAAPWQSCRRAPAGQREMVNAPLTISVGNRETARRVKGGRMDLPFIHGRAGAGRCRPS